MLPYLQKFNELPPELRQKISSPEIMKNIRELEEKYSISLATLVIRVMVKDISPVDLVKYFVFEYDMDGRQAGDIVEDLKEKVFFDVAEYLGFEKEEPSRIETAEKEQEMRRKEKGALEDWMDKKRKEAAVRGSGFFFSSDDEEEIRGLTKRLEEYKKEISEQQEEEEDEMEEVYEETRDPEMKKEIRKIKRKPKRIDQKTMIDIIIGKLGINFSSSNLNNRCRQIIKTYLNEIRNKIDTKQTIIKSIDNGGLGLDPGVADKIIFMSDKAKRDGFVEPLIMEKFKKADFVKDQFGQYGSLEVRSAEENAGNTFHFGDVGYDFKGTQEEQDEKRREIASRLKQVIPRGGSGIRPDAELTLDLKGKDLDVKREEAVPAGERKKTGKNVKKASEIEMVDLSKKDKKEEPASVRRLADSGVAKTASASSSGVAKQAENIISVRRPKSFKPAESALGGGSMGNGKVKMEDVKYTPKLTGPIDELKEMNLKYFYGLGRDPEKAAKAIKEKLSYLEEESYAKRLEGIKAWRESPLNKLYLELGQEGISGERGIKEIIAERKAAGKSYLTEEEFNVIMDLNREIRF